MAEITVPDEATDRVEVCVELKNDGKVAAEWLRAVRVSPTTARIISVPFFTEDCANGDLVEICQDFKVTRVLERCGRTRWARYTYTMGMSADAHDTLIKRFGHFLFACDLTVEPVPHQPGLIAFHVPTAITDLRLTEISRFHTYP